MDVQEDSPTATTTTNTTAGQVLYLLVQSMYHPDQSMDTRACMLAELVAALKRCGVYAEVRLIVLVPWRKSHYHVLDALYKHGFDCPDTEMDKLPYRPPHERGQGGHGQGQGSAGNADGREGERGFLGERESLEGVIKASESFFVDLHKIVSRCLRRGRRQ